VTRRVPVPPQSPDAGVPGPVPAGCRRHALLLCELLQLSWRRVPGLVTLQFAVQVAEIAAAAAAAMGMRDVVDDAVHRDAYAAMAAALVAALGGALYMACSAVLGITTIAAIEKVGSMGTFRRFKGLSIWRTLHSSTASPWCAVEHGR
jgi:hypothetical protein